MRKVVLIISVCLCVSHHIIAQTQMLSLDKCKELALENNKRLAAQRAAQVSAQETRRIANTLYLPKFDLTASYLYTSKELSILNDDQKSVLSNLGMVFADIAPTLAGTLNQVGEHIVDAFRTDSRNVWVGAVSMSQPLYLGGKITAANNIADIGVELAQNQLDSEISKLELSTSNAYWLAVSLRHKQKLAQNYRDLLLKLQGDVDKMVHEGVATKADYLNVSVKVNEAEMTLIQVNDGLVLSKMALCRLCGIPVDSDITLEDEQNQDITDEGGTPDGDIGTALSNRAEIRILSNVEDIANQNIKIARSGYKPNIALTAGYMISNPNLFNGFEKKFSGMWNVGIAMNMPLWHWGDTKHKIRAAKSAARIASLNKQDTQDLITLQVSQDRFRLDEARKKLSLTEKNIESADENLKSAEYGFKEGLFTVSTVMEAQTAWLKAKTQKIDAQIDVKLALTELSHALGTR